MGQQILLSIHILLAVAIIGLVLLQHGKGAEVGAAFGSGASQTLFGSRGATSFLAKLTAIFALCFAITSISMGYMTTHKEEPKSILEKIEEMQKSEEIPALPKDTQDTH
jgi:preprotein translocase subunit SecG